jgi:hypothetical protein
MRLYSNYSKARNAIIQMEKTYVDDHDHWQCDKPVRGCHRVLVTKFLYERIFFVSFSMS